jgi:hypothetical protein
MSSNGFSSAGGFTGTLYDKCSYQRDLSESVSPLQYQLMFAKFENCNKCVYDENSFFTKHNSRIIDTESELKNITRRYSKCPQHKYNPNCKKSCGCTSTFDRSVPTVMAQEVCPIIYNNIPPLHNRGYKLNNMGSMCPYSKRV